MIYHYTSWWVETPQADTFLGRVGLYGVSVFYVLSGLTLFHVYYDKMRGSRDVASFAIKRVFRIFPLLWIVTIVAILLRDSAPPLGDVVLNLTGLFGFVKWDAYLSAGVWSIGNELVFYVLFPLIVFAARRASTLLALVGVAIAAPYVYFAFWGLSSTESLGEQWSIYINPLNQAFLFFGGFAIGYVLRGRRVHQVVAGVTIVCALLVFTFWPTGTESITLVTGVNRMLFTLVCFAICAAVYRVVYTLPNLLDVPLKRLGEASYSVYLIHPLVHGAIVALGVTFIPVPLLMLTAIVITLGVSWACYWYFERYFMRLGRRVAARANTDLVNGGRA